MAETLNTYATYLHPIEGPEVVKTGFSWPGFFFGFVWAFVKRLWIPGLALLGLEAVQQLMNYYASGGPTAVFGVFNFAVHVTVGVKGNDLRRLELASREFELLGSVRAKDDEEAMEMLEEELDRLKRLSRRKREVRAERE